MSSPRHQTATGYPNSRRRGCHESRHSEWTRLALQSLRSLALLRVGAIECTAQGLCELHRIVVRPDVHVEEARHVIQCMAMQSYRLNAVILQNLHNGSNLFPQQREVPGNGGFSIAGRLEVDRGAHSH